MSLYYWIKVYLVYAVNLCKPKNYSQIVSTIVYLLAKVYIDTVGDAEKYRIKLTEKFPGIKFVVAKKADSLFPVVSGASIVAKVIPYMIFFPPIIL